LSTDSSNSTSNQDDESKDSMKDNQESLLKLDSAYERAVPHEIPSLFTNFYSASTILRIARFNGELVSEDEGETLHDFFELLNTIENSLHPKSRSRRADRGVGPFIIVVEGLDGTGKSSLVESLAQELKTTRCMATRTPSKALKAARAIFDTRGGAVARAFYMVCNYVLQHEIQQEQQNHQPSSYDDEQTEAKRLTVVVDRWYSSTCAYSIGQHTQGGSEGIDALEDDSLFQWPHDLEPPGLVLLLEATNDVRRQRVQSRNLPVDLSEWDDRLARNEQLCQRIQQSFKRVTGPRETVVLDANQSKGKVLHSALSVAEERIRRHFKE
jgi:thymidylate kinase